MLLEFIIIIIIIEQDGKSKEEDRKQVDGFFSYLIFQEDGHKFSERIKCFQADLWACMHTYN